MQRVMQREGEQVKKYNKKKKGGCQPATKNPDISRLLTPNNKI